MLAPAEEAAAASVIASARDRASREAATVRAARSLTPEASQRLAAIWASMWSEMERALPSRASRLRALRRHL
jgi:hypothetical protein